MQALRFSILIVIYLCLHTFEAEAQWVQTNGPYGGHVNSLAVSGMNLFAATDNGGVFLSTNNGTSWSAAGLANTYVYGLAVSGTNLFAGTSGGGVFLSTDNGTMWTAVNAGLSNTYISCLAISGANLFAGTMGGGVWLSTDNGASWTPASTGLTNSNVGCLAVSGANLFAGTPGGVFLSTDNGTSWIRASNGLTSSVIAALAVSGAGLFAGARGGGVYHSTDNGTSWSEINAGLMNLDVYALAFSGTNLVAGTGGGVYLSSDEGTNWIVVSAGLISTAVRSLCVSGTNLFAGTAGQGAYLSADNGTSWIAVNTGLTNTNVNALAVSSKNLFAGTPGGVYLSTDTGNSWTAVNTGLTNTNVNALVISGTTLFAGTEGGGVFLSTNSGTSWIAAGLSNIPIYAFAVSGTNLFAASYGAVFRSTDNGTTWTGSSSGLWNTYVHSLAVSGTNLFAGNFPGVYLSTNNGAFWNTASVGLPNTYVYVLSVSGTNLFAGTDVGVFRSTNNGTTWSAAGTTSSYVYALAGSGTNLFAGTPRDGVFLSANSGNSWTAANTGLLKTNVHALAVSDANLLAGTYYGCVWRRPLTEFVTPEAPVPLSPTSGLTGIPMNYSLKWSSSVGATSYRFQISTSPSFSIVTVDSTGSNDTVATFSGLASSTTYYWRANAANAGGTSLWSSTWSFTTQAAHIVPLPQGWNLVSSFVAPKDSTLDSMFVKIKSHLVIAKNNSGQVYWPSLSINQIGKWKRYHGYQVYMQSADTMTVNGDEIDPEQTPIVMTQGWNMVSYLRNTPMRADSATATIAGNLVIAKNNAGQVYWPALSINQMGNMKPGQGYQMYLSSGGTLTYPANVGPAPPSLLTKTAIVAASEQEIMPEHYVVRVAQTGNSATLLIQGSGVSDGDEVGVTVGGEMLIGAGVVFQGRAIVTMWGDDLLTEGTKEGAGDGETMVLKLWQKKTQQEKVLEIETMTDGLTGKDQEKILRYATDRVWVVGVKEAKAIPTVFSLEQNYPNPFNPSTVIRYGLPKDVGVKLAVYNVLGQQVMALVNEEQKAGYHEVVFQAGNLSSGVYFYSLVAGEFRRTKKLLMIK